MSFRSGGLVLGNLDTDRACCLPKPTEVQVDALRRAFAHPGTVG